jgi:hypothetical protein
MKAEWKNSSIVKALLNGGFDEEYIEKAIENGDIILEKSKTEKEMEHSKEDEEKNVVDDEKHIEDLEEDEDEDDDDIEDLDEDIEEKGKKKSKEKVEKSFNRDLMKSFGFEMKEAFKEAIKEEIEPLRKSIEAIGAQPTPFRSEGLDNATFLQKSIGTMKDDNGKITVNIVKQRPLARTLIEKAIDSVQDDEVLMKSIGDDVFAYLTNPEAETVGENLARYMYDSKNVKFVR